LPIRKRKDGCTQKNDRKMASPMKTGRTSFATLLES
jgi:hypothetical protein